MFSDLTSTAFNISSGESLSISISCFRSLFNCVLNCEWFSWKQLRNLEADSGFGLQVWISVNYVAEKLPYVLVGGILAF